MKENPLVQGQSSAEKGNAENKAVTEQPVYPAKVVNTLLRDSLAWRSLKKRSHLFLILKADAIRALFSLPEKRQL